MNRERIYVQKTLEHLEKCLRSWVVMRGNSVENSQELAEMLRDTLLESAEKLTEKYELEG
jgi:hypothetical protein